MSHEHSSYDNVVNELKETISAKDREIKKYEDMVSELRKTVENMAAGKVETIHKFERMIESLKAQSNYDIEGFRAELDNFVRLNIELLNQIMEQTQQIQASERVISLLEVGFEKSQEIKGLFEKRVSTLERDQAVLRQYIKAVCKNYDEAKEIIRVLKEEKKQLVLSNHMMKEHGVFEFCTTEVIKTKKKFSKNF